MFLFFYFLFTIQSNINRVTFVFQTLYIIVKKLLQKHTDLSFLNREYPFMNRDSPLVRPDLSIFFF